MKTNIFHKAIGKAKKLTLPIGISIAILGFASCSDFVDQTSDRIADASENHLSSNNDTIYSVLGIVNKMQAIADRTILLGEMRGDLVDVNTSTASDLRDVALFNIGKDNAYNSLADYYAVINNCNYFLANVPVDLKNTRNEYIFRKEYSAVKAFRAWTYLQLALNYGSVPFVTEPILTEEQSEKDYPKYDIKQICDYFISDLQGLENYDIPNYGTLRSTVDSRLFFIPINVLLGDLNLWAGNYRDAALCYYKYLYNRSNGSTNTSAIGNYYAEWMRSDTKWKSATDTWASNFFGETSEQYGEELITLIPGDSIPAEGNYSQLRNLFNSTTANNYSPTVVASKRIKEISDAQVYCHLTNKNEIMYAPEKTGVNDLTGDLRYYYAYPTMGTITVNGKSYKYVSCQKHDSQNVHIYRKTMIYLRLAEALNRAGFPRFAFKILQKGVNNEVIGDEIMPYYPDDQAFLAQFDFPTEKYILRTTSESTAWNTFGIHSHGSGWTDRNEYYTMPYDETNDSTLTEKYSATDLLQNQIEGVEDLITDEEALEFAFEGYRFYDLMRIALRRNDPAYLADRVYARRGISNVSTMKAEIKKDLYNTANWYLPME